MRAATCRVSTFSDVAHEDQREGAVSASEYHQSFGLRNVPSNIATR